MYNTYEHNAFVGTSICRSDVIPAMDVLSLLLTFECDHIYIVMDATTNLTITKLYISCIVGYYCVLAGVNTLSLFYLNLQINTFTMYWNFGYSVIIGITYKNPHNNLFVPQHTYFRMLQHSFVSTSCKYTIIKLLTKMAETCKQKPREPIGSCL